MDATSKKVPIKTVARVRPCSDGTKIEESPLKIDSENSIITVKTKNKEFRLNNVFDENATQETLYDTIAQPIVDEVLGGKNGTIFAYGQTGSGKTYTMNGSSVNGNTRGIVPRSVESIFEYLNARLKNDPQFKFSIKCSYIEVYKQVAFDLLQTDGATLKIRDYGEHIIIEGVAEFVVKSVEQCLRYLQNGWNNRKTAETSMNRESSRSHAIFMLTLVTKDINGCFVNLRTSRLNFVDLAGSENQKHTKNTGERLKEGACINQDLSHLANVIRKIANKDAHIPYRDRFLTHLLRDSLGGNSTTAVIVTVHPNLEFDGDTDSTLKFAENCKKIKNKVKVNEAVSTKDVEAWKAEIQKAQAENVTLKEEKEKLLKENQQLKEEKERMEERHKEDADTVLILQNEKKTLEAEGVKYVQEVNGEKQNLQTQISLLEKNVAEQKEKINALEKRQKEVSELAKMKNEYDLKIKEVLNDLNKANDALQKIEDKLDEYKLLVAEKDEIIEKSKIEIEAKISEYETLLEKTSAEHKDQEKIQKEAYELQIAQMKKKYDLKIKELEGDLKKANEMVEDKEGVTQMDLDADFNASFDGGDHTIPEAEGNQTIDLTEENSFVEEREKYGHVEGVVGEDDMQTSQTGNGSGDDTIQLLTVENATINRRKRKLLDPTLTCDLADVIVNDKIDYKRLNGKTLLVYRLNYSNGKWFMRHVRHAAKMEIDFEPYDFKIFPQFELVLNNHPNISSVINRIICSNLKDLQLSKITIPFSDFKKLTANKIFSFHIFRSTINDENGIKVGLDKIWKEVENAETLKHDFCDGEVITTEIAQNLSELPTFPNLLNVWLWNVQEGFDLETFGEFIRKNPTIVDCNVNLGKVSIGFYQEIERIEKNLLPTLPSTCHLH